jgi:hypothetical protein
MSRRRTAFCLLAASAAAGCAVGRSGDDAPPFRATTDLWQERAPAAPPQPEADAEALAKKTQNPVADLISVPLQSNFGFGYGPDDDVQWILNIQPVVPVHLSEEWNLINRVIAPVLYQPGVVPGQADIGGLGDIQYEAFFSPADSESFVWGVGPVVQFPSATDERLGARRWALGPAAVALVMEGPWVGGAIANNLWSLGDSSSRPDVNLLLVQPFLNYNFGEGWYLASAPASSSRSRTSRSTRSSKPSTTSPIPTWDRIGCSGSSCSSSSESV